VGRPKLNLTKRTVSEATDLPSPSSTPGDAKASPFGAARPIDTAAKEREIEEKRLATIREKKEAEEKAKEEKREAAKAAKAAEAEKQEAEVEKVEILQRPEGEEVAAEGDTIEKENQNGNIIDDKSVKPKEIVRDIKPKPSDTGAWRRPSGGPPPLRDDIPRGPRGRGRGRGEGRGGPRHFEDRQPRQNTNGGGSPAVATQAPAAEPEAAALEEDGWSTVSKPKKNNRGGNAGARAIAS
jgi:translation initiation factor 4B